MKKRSLEIVLEKLSDPEASLNKELKRGAVKVSKALGLPTVQKPKTVLKKNKAEVETIETPTLDMDLPAPPAPAPEKKEKSKWSFYE